MDTIPKYFSIVNRGEVSQSCKKFEPKKAHVDNGNIDVITGLVSNPYILVVYPRIRIFSSDPDQTLLCGLTLKMHFLCDPKLDIKNLVKSKSGSKSK